ncbi:hypothetical protein [Nostoc sp. FACHB-888]|uniref:hypothetical protein n=1 Tax=Nostoc sp. FACHB-888 TaxID=2692842 RepID=UPI001685C48E|nr:hypothetical protein [Nostoc sp. FACHB-888]MBD2243967.1 hypothetical protein [Nostoc sp. FACHB-888]
MFRSLIALIVALVLTIAGITEPAYADSSNSNLLFVDSNIINNSGYANVNNWNDSFNSLHFPELENIGEKIFDTVVDGFIKTGGFAIGGALACYALDGIATTIFPPAAAAVAFCPVVGAASGGAKAFAGI